METRTIHQSLHRQAHVLGGEREPVMISALIALLVGLGGLTFLSITVSILFWIVAIFCLRGMAQRDPIMTKVWLRHVSQQPVYLARSSRWRGSLGGYKC